MDDVTYRFRFEYFIKSDTTVQPADVERYFNEVVASTDPFIKFKSNWVKNLFIALLDNSQSNIWIKSGEYDYELASGLNLTISPEGRTIKSLMFHDTWFQKIGDIIHHDHFDSDLFW